eukprot:scaffold931_cov117-Isochrysis_galbana.AAC.11
MGYTRRGAPPRGSQSCGMPPRRAATPRARPTRPTPGRRRAVAAPASTRPPCRPQAPARLARGAPRTDIRPESA